MRPPRASKRRKALMGSPLAAIWRLTSSAAPAARIRPSQHATATAPPDTTPASPWAPPRPQAPPAWRSALPLQPEDPSRLADSPHFPRTAFQAKLQGLQRREVAQLQEVGRAGQSVGRGPVRRNAGVCGNVEQRGQPAPARSALIRPPRRRPRPLPPERPPIPATAASSGSRADSSTPEPARSPRSRSRSPGPAAAHRSIRGSGARSASPAPRPRSRG